jgi:hypothetical protein
MMLLPVTMPDEWIAIATRVVMAGTRPGMTTEELAAGEAP